jgi:fatty acid desaturase
MIAAGAIPGRRGVLRHSRWDALPVALAVLHGGALLALPAAPVVAVGLWWNSNTVAHYFLHRPFFRGRALNIAFALYLSVLLGVPQTLWRERHLAHHACRPWRLCPSRQLGVESALIVALWAALLALAPAFFLTAYLPGYLAGLGLCWLHGHYEHAGGDTISHHGALYNFLFLNDGYHVEHHADPSEHWTRLPHHARLATRPSAWPAVLRWLETPWLERLERLVLRSRHLQRFLLDRHERAFAALLPRLPDLRRVGIVGGGLWPRTALVLRRLLPQARLAVIDRSAENLAAAAPLLPAGVEVINDFYDPSRMNGFDLLVIPLSLLGDRAALYRRPPAPAVLVHDWVWRRRGEGVVVSWLLLKRLNLVKPCAP